MADLTTAQIGKLNKMNKAAQEATLGTRIATIESEIDTLQTSSAKVARGSYTMIAADQTAGTKTIATGLGASIAGWLVQVYRSNVLLGLYTVTASSANLTIATNSTDYVVTTGDVVKWQVWSA